MLLIIENKNDPTGQIAEETEGPADYVYIPVIQVALQGSAQQTNLKYLVDKLCYECRSSPSPAESRPYAQKLLPLFLKAVAHTGQCPQYLTKTAEEACGIPAEGKLNGGFCTCG